MFALAFKLKNLIKSMWESASADAFSADLR